MPAAERGGTPAQIQKNIQHFPTDHAPQLALRFLNLVMEAAEDPSHRAGMIVLDEFAGDAEAGENLFVVTLEKKSALVFEHLGFEHQCAGERSFQNFHG